MSPSRKVFLIDEQIYADLILEGTYASRVQYVYGGVLYDVMIENNEFIVEDDYDIEWEEEE